MGRWAQRTRRGGGPGTRPPATITIDNVDVNGDPGSVTVQFSDPVNVADFLPSDFFLDVGSGFFNGLEPCAQVSPIEISWTNTSEWATIPSGSPWQYLGTAPDVITPQSGTTV